MKITNHTNLPAPLVEALRNDDYTRGEANISATGLIAPARKVALEELHRDVLEEDAADKAAILIGKAVHAYIANKATGELSDKRRLMMAVNGWVVSGQTDHVEGLEVEIDNCPVHRYNTTYDKAQVDPFGGQVLGEGGEGRELLGVDGRNGGGVRLSGAGAQRGWDRGGPPNIVATPLRGDTAGDGRVPPLRQPQVRATGSSVSGNAPSEHAGREPQGAPSDAATSSQGWVAEGQAAQCTGHRVIDWKSTSVNEWKYGLKEERAQQLNIYAEILRSNGYNPTGLTAVLIFKDWSATQARFGGDYPPHSIMEVDVPLWAREQAQAYIIERVRAHQTARVELPECSDEERWLRGTKWAVRKLGNKAATKLHDTEAEAVAHAAELYTKDHRVPYEVDFRPGTPIRCMHYCTVGAMGLCEQWANERPMEESR